MHNGFPCPPPGHLTDPGIEPVTLMSPTLVGGFFITSATWEAPLTLHIHYQKLPILRASPVAQR